MRAVLLFLTVLAASAQAGEDARSLLKSISNAMRSADSLRAEGVSVRDTTAEQGTSHQEMSFELATQGPLMMRFERGGYRPGLQICDGTWLWVYAQTPNIYVKNAANAEDCNSPVARWSDLTKYLVEAKVIGNDHSDFEGRSQDCEVIEATYETPRALLPGVPSAGRLERIFLHRSTSPPDIARTAWIGARCKFNWRRTFLDDDHLLPCRVEPRAGSQRFSIPASGWES